MRGGLHLAALVLGMLALPATAQDLQTSPRPQARPALMSVEPGAGAPLSEQPVVAAEGTDAAQAAAPSVPSVRPRPRPGVASLPPQPQSLALAAPTLRPMPRPAGLASPQAQVQETSAPAPTVKPERRGGLFGGLFGRRNRETAPVPADGFVCGDRAIRGEELAPITSRVRGCGIAEPVRVTSVDGIRLTTPATIDCTTARALKSWIEDGMRPAFGRQEVVELRIAASYICRPRNNVRGAKISEHGRGKAIDISGFILSDGRELSIAGDYNRTIRRAHKAACGVFGTTLGPGSDGYHEDHLHFDTANLDRPYCR